MTRRFFLSRLMAAFAAVSAFALSSGLPAVAKDKPLKVAAVYTVPVEQQWVSRIHLALKAAEARGDITYTFSENVANTDYERVMREYAEQGSDMIFGEAFAVEKAARKVAADYPNIAFVLGSSFGPEEPNFSVFDNYIQEASYLSGLVAGKATKSNKIGLVGGFPIPEVNRLMNAFIAGVKEVNPEATFTVTFIGSWYDPPKAKEAAFAMIDAGADVLYAERFGVSDAAKERGVKAIGNVIDTSKDYPGVILASALWHFEPTADYAIKQVLEGTYKAEDLGKYSEMKVGGATLAPLDPALVPADVVELVKAKEKAILDGSFKVEVVDTEPKP